MTLALGVLVSGSGSNLQAILDGISSGELDAECRIVICNRPGAHAIERAKRAGVPVAVLDHKSFDSRGAFDKKMVETLRAEGVEWIALAGFMRVLTPVFLSAFPDKVVNIHPSLLPAFPGVNAQKQAFDYGVKVAGCSVHFVDGGVDSGPVILQAGVEVTDTDTLESLRARILEQEHQLFVKALGLIAQQRIKKSPDRRRVLIED